MDTKQPGRNLTSTEDDETAPHGQKKAARRLAINADDSRPTRSFLKLDGGKAFDRVQLSGEPRTRALSRAATGKIHTHIPRGRCRRSYLPGH